MRRAPGLALLLGLGACGPCSPGHREVRWPASPEVQLADELLVTARRAGARAPVLASGETDDRVVLPPDAPGVRATSFVYAGLWAAEVVLGDVDVATPLPLVVMLHGRGDHPRVPGGPFGRAPTPMRVLVPRGPLRLGSGYAWARSSVTQERHAELARDLIAAAERLDDLIAHVAATRPTVGTPIVTGFSQGGMLAWTLALRHPERVGLAIPIAGWVPPEARPASVRAPTTHAMHGDADDIVRIEPTRALVEALRAQGNAVQWSEYAGVGHVVTPEMNQAFEDWLEAALRERAPGLTGGLGEAGPEPEPVEPFEPPLDVDLSEDAVEAPPLDAGAFEDVRDASQAPARDPLDTTQPDASPTP